MKFVYPEGATPLNPDELDGLLPSHITTQKQLNEWEFANIKEAELWAFGRKHRNLVTVDFMTGLHKRMFGETWGWAGTFRLTEKNIGIAPQGIRVALRDLCADVVEQLKHQYWTLDEIAARFHHRLVSIHPFPNGNGRFSRTMADLLLVQNGQERFPWGYGDLVKTGETRRFYISALQAADARDYEPLLRFVRSGE